MVRALPSHQCDPGSYPRVDAICGLSLLLVLFFAPRGFSPGTPVFPSPQKPAFPNSNSTRNQVDEEPLCGCANSKSLFICLFIYLFIHRAVMFSSDLESKLPDSEFRFKILNCKNSFSSKLWLIPSSFYKCDVT